MSRSPARHTLWLAAVLALPSCGSDEATSPSAGATATDVDVRWCTQYGRFASAAAAVEIDAETRDAASRIEEVRAEGGAPADDLAAAMEEAEILVLDTEAPAAIDAALPRLLQDDELDPAALAAVQDHIRASCGAGPEHVPLLTRLAGG